MSDGFVSLWPTTLLRRQLPGADAANQALAELLLELDHQHSAGNSGVNLTTDYLEQDLLENDHPAIKWLAACINKSVADYLRHSGITIDVSWKLQVWGNINRTGDYHNLHNHPHCYLSGTYYVKVPGSSSTNTRDNIGSRIDLNPNAISFYDPRAQANMTAIAGDNQIDPEYRVQPEAGLIMLWPAFLHHFVHPNLCREERVSISFNVLLERENKSPVS